MPKIVYVQSVPNMSSPSRLFLNGQGQKCLKEISQLFLYFVTTQDKVYFKKNKTYHNVFFFPTEILERNGNKNIHDVCVSNMPHSASLRPILQVRSFFELALYQQNGFRHLINPHAILQHFFYKKEALHPLKISM